MKHFLFVLALFLSLETYHNAQTIDTLPDTLGTRSNAQAIDSLPDSVMTMTIAALADSLSTPSRLLPDTAIGVPMVFLADSLSSQWTSISQSHQWGEHSDSIVWSVYSDRENVSCRLSPDDTSEVFYVASFLEKFNVADIQGEYALLYKDPLQKTLVISDSVEFVGWVPLDNLLLWSTHLHDDSIPYDKVVVVASIIKGGKTEKYRVVMPSFSKSPTENVPISKKSKPLEIFYILKITSDGSALLVNEKNVETALSKKAKIGWVSKEKWCAIDPKKIREASRSNSKGKNLLKIN